MFHKRRTYYRNCVFLVRHRAARVRSCYNLNKRQQYRNPDGVDVVTELTRERVLLVVPPTVPGAMLHLYRARVDDPLHAIGAELWLGQNKVAQIEPVHTMRLMPHQVKEFLKEILTEFSGQVSGGGVTQFEIQKELSPDCCPIRPCPLHN